MIKMLYHQIYKITHPGSETVHCSGVNSDENYLGLLLQCIFINDCPILMIEFNTYDEFNTIQ